MSTARPHTTFVVLWYSGGPEHAPNRVVGREYIKRPDLTAAITSACNMLKAGKGDHAHLAQGFYVRKARPDELES